MTLTWRQVDAFLEFSDRLDRIDRGYALTISRVGAQGDDKTFGKMLKELGPR